jgi:hypothetical protein
MHGACVAGRKPMSPLTYLLGAAFCVSVSACGATDETSTEDDGVEVSEALCSENWEPWKKCVQDLSGTDLETINKVCKYDKPKPCPPPKKPKKK